MLSIKLSRQHNRTLEIGVGLLTILFSITGFILLWNHWSNPAIANPSSIWASQNLNSPASLPHLGIRFLYELHAHCLAGSTLGSAIVCLSGLAVMTVSITGMRRWPGWKRPHQGFRIRKTLNSRILLFDIHSALGAIAFIFLLLISLSGTILSLQSILLSLDVSTSISNDWLHGLDLIFKIALTLHHLSYQSGLAILVYALFAIAVLLVAITGVAMGVRNIYRKSRRAL